jgi:hypothetical protein
VISMLRNLGLVAMLAAFAGVLLNAVEGLV